MNLAKGRVGLEMIAVLGGSRGFIPNPRHWRLLQFAQAVP